MGPRRERAVDDAPDIDVEHPARALGPKLADEFIRLGRMNAGVIDQYVDAAVAGRDVVHGPCHRILDRDIGMKGCRPCPDLCGSTAHGAFVDVEESDPRSPLGERLAERPAKAAPTARHPREFAGEIERFHISLPCPQTRRLASRRSSWAKPEP